MRFTVSDWTGNISCFLMNEDELLEIITGKSLDEIVELSKSDSKINWSKVLGLKLNHPWRLRIKAYQSKFYGMVFRSEFQVVNGERINFSKEAKELALKIISC